MKMVFHGKFDLCIDSFWYAAAELLVHQVSLNAQALLSSNSVVKPSLFLTV